jgi:hypothetical protein
MIIETYYDPHQSDAAQQVTYQPLETNSFVDPKS